MSEGPNYQLQIIRLKHSLLQQETALFKQTVDKMEACSRIRQASENEIAHQKAIADLKTQISDLENTHGIFSASNVTSLAAELSTEDKNG